MGKLSYNSKSKLLRNIYLKRKIVIIIQFNNIAKVEYYIIKS